MNDDSKIDSETDSWYELYKERYRLESNWKNDKFPQHNIQRHPLKNITQKMFWQNEHVIYIV